MRRHFRSPLARWGFPLLCLVAYAGHFYQGAIVAGAITFYAWNAR